jgi:hypothetical protein
MPGFKDVSQIAVITRDAEASIRAIGQALGAGSFKIATLEPPALFNTTYDGEPRAVAMRVGVTWIGQMLLEVIQPLTRGNVYSDYLERRDERTGIEHILLQLKDLTYAQALQAFTQAGYPPIQHGQMNAAGRLGALTVPPMPAFLARRFATRFCYTATQDALKLDVELAHFAFGVPYRAGLRIAAAETWIPDEAHFESVPAEAVVSDIDTVYVLGRDLDALAQAYARLTDRQPQIARFADDVLPGKGRLAEIRFDASALVLVEPQSGPLAVLLAERGEGVHLVGGPAHKPASEPGLDGRGWRTQPGPGGLFAVHADVPFALLVRP